MSESQGHLFEFGEFRLDTAERLLLRAGKPLPLPPKVFDMLVVFVQNSGHLLKKEQLMNELWPDTFVEEVNLSVNISALRKALGDSENGMSFIETAPRGGYRFVGEVRRLHDRTDLMAVPNDVKAGVISEEFGVNELPESNGGGQNIATHPATSNGDLHEIRFTPKAGRLDFRLVNSGQVTDIGGFYSSDDQAKHAICIYPSSDVKLFYYI